MHRMKDYIILAPMLPMIIHIYEFFEVDYMIIRVLVALTFDLTLFLLFKFLRVKELRKDKEAMRAVWSAISIMTLFQLYANIRVYWQADPGPDAVMRGAIFPIMFAFLSWITTRLDTLEMRKKEQPDRPAETTVTPPKINKSETREIPAADIDQRELCEIIFDEIADKTDAIKQAVAQDVPKSTAYRYYNIWKSEGTLI